MSYSVLIRLVLSFSDGRSFIYAKLRLVGISFIPKLFPTISLSQSLIPSLGCVERFTGILPRIEFGKRTLSIRDKYRHVPGLFHGR